jgi:hypothetical protein
MNAIKNIVHHLNEEELKLLATLREKRSQIKVRPAFRFGDRWPIGWPPSWGHGALSSSSRFF